MQAILFETEKPKCLVVKLRTLRESSEIVAHLCHWGSRAVDPEESGFGKEAQPQRIFALSNAHRHSATAKQYCPSSSTVARQQNQIFLISSQSAGLAVPNICPISVGGRRQMTRSLTAGARPLF
ncbi:hypothetical protein [Methylocystis sp. B8]|uniref:hypothetical protein n=1 Tax=Methylocystis sp. B8 TaxID=544938 RepID=UPI0010FED44D|nr:hypothetical protein [Methylocystis sp. B8]TLG71262.1 hypothetical protein FEV16_16485 [Methylocystis sp. B8]